jgi:deazaflavin-dependent oxidoreductase (nitroreductase family)
MTDFTDKATLNAFNKNIIDEFRANGGKVGGPFEGATLLLLTTTGAKSGEHRLSPLAYLTIDGKTIIVGSKAGADTNPHWVHNLRANPRAQVEVGTGSSGGTGSSDGIVSYEVTARELPSEERDATWAKIAAASEVFAGYQAQTSRVIPLFELQRV